MPDFTNDERFDGLYMNVAQTARGIEPLLDTVFSFLRRKTDFFSGPPNSEGDVTEAAVRKVNDVLQKHKDIYMRDLKMKQKKEEVRKRKEEEKKRKKREEEERNKREERKRKGEEEGVIEMEGGGFDVSDVMQAPPVSEEPPKKEPAKKEPPKEEAPAASNETPAAPKKDDDEEEEEKSPPPPGNGGTVPDKYTWTQTLSELSLLTPLPPNIRSKDLTISIQKKHLLIRIKPSTTICDAPLSHPIIIDDSFWTIEDSILSISLQKSNQMEWWDCVCEGDPKIDTKAIQPENSNLSDLDGEMRQTVEKMMYDQRQKALGLPTSEEKKKWDVLETFKKQHPEMDFSQAKIS